MLNDATGFRKVYIAVGYTDLLLRIDGLATIINLTSSWTRMKKLSFFCSVEDAVTGSKDLYGKVTGFFSYIKVLPPFLLKKKDLSTITSYPMVRMTKSVFVSFAFAFILRYSKYQKNKRATYMAQIYSPEELNNLSQETLVAVILSMQDQLSQLNANMERLIEQIADVNNKRYGRSCEKLDVIVGQLELELIFNEAEALTETLYVVEPAEEDVIQVRHQKEKRET